jgi:hypothetical protein
MKRSRSGSLPTLLAALLVVSRAIDAQVGTVLEERKISNLEGGFPGQLGHDEYFGTSAAALGDLNGDGTGDLAVSDYADGGSVWILLLDRSGRVIGHNRVTGVGGQYSHGLASPGDLDGDGLAELAVSINVRTRTTTTIAVDVLFLRPDGSVRRSQRIEPTDPVFLPRIRSKLFDYFGYGLAGLGDADRDGVGDLVIGAPSDEDGPGPFNGSLWIVYLERDGRPKKAHKISERFGGGEGLLHTRQLGTSIAPLGDLDGDGNLDLVVGEPTSYFVQPGSDILVLFLDEDQKLREVRKIFQQECGLPPGGSAFGQALAVLGDLDGDGAIEIAVGAPNWKADGAVLPQGAILVGSLRRDGSLARSVLISGERGGFGRELEESTSFGYSLAALGDLDGDGGPDLVVGAYTDEDGADEAGAVWIVDLDASAVRNGTGVNPSALRQAAEPSVGHYWKLALDCSGHGPGLAYVAGFAAPDPGQLTPAGELLVDIASPRLFRQVAPQAGTTASFLAPIPRNVSLIGRAMYVQGLCSGAPGLQLSNALDVIIGR